jgi:gas vesicle protein
VVSYEVEQEGRRPSGGAFLAGLLMGAAIGAGLALLFAPKKGSELRGQIAESAKKARESAREAYAQASQKASAAASRAVSEVERIVGHTRGQQS